MKPQPDKPVVLLFTLSSCCFSSRRKRQNGSNEGSSIETSLHLKTFHWSGGPVACVALAPASSTGPNPRHTGSHLTSSLVGHFPSVDLSSNTAARISAKPQTETLSSRHNNSHTRAITQKPARGFPLFAYSTHLPKQAR